jgi:N-acetylglutamate synthase-like GNAT family acetyltransferase
MLNFRAARNSDKDRVIEISSKVWNGHDYVPKVYEKWMGDNKGEFTIAEKDGEIIGFARYSKVNDSEIWLEGIRMDEKYRNNGFATELTEYYIEKARNENAKVLRLSSYIGSVESMRISEKTGFKKDGCFSYCYKDIDKETQAKPSSHVINLMSTATAWHFATKSSYFMMANGYISYGWRFKKLDYELMDQLVRNKQVYGVIKDGKITAMMIITENSHGEDGMTIGFLEGESAGLKLLLEYSLVLAAEKSAKYVSTMAVMNEKIIDVLALSGFRFYAKNPKEVNVYVYCYNV